MLPPLTRLARELLVFEYAGQCGVGPHGVARPISFRGKSREEPPVERAAKCDRAVGKSEHVLPERVTRPEGLHCREVVAPACRRNVHRMQLRRL